MKTAIEYLKNAMSVKYCGKTRFDFLDPEEVILVEKAMESYAKQWSKEKDKRIAERGYVFYCTRCKKEFESDTLIKQTYR